MAKLVKLTDAKIVAALKGLPSWKHNKKSLQRKYEFADFITAFSFMTGAGLVAQQMNHHPEWFNVYGSVRIDLSTHDAGGITALDVKLAHAMETLAARLPMK